MSRSRVVPPLALLALVALLAGATECSYRGRDLGGRTPELATHGPLAGVGTVRVAGADWSTDRATITLDGERVTEAELRVGQVAGVFGRPASGGEAARADTLAVETALVGAVSAVDAQAGELTVLGQRVRLAADTTLDRTPSTPLATAWAVGDRIAVHGLDLADGLLATRIEAAPATRALRLAGRVDSVDSAARLLRIRGATVDWSGAGSVDGDLRAGAWAVASGTATTADGRLRATRVVLRGAPPSTRDGDAGELDGLVTAYASATDFAVAGRAATTDANTTWVEGTAADLGPGDRVRVSGRHDGSGRLLARRVEFARAAQARVLAPIEAFDGGANFTAAGIRWRTDAWTRWDDRLAFGLRALRYGDLRSGDWVEVRGIEDAAVRTATALVVERVPAPAGFRVELQGVPGRVANPALEVLDVAVSTGSAEFRDRADAALSRTQFFGQAGGAVVRARGAFAGGTLNAENVALRP